MSRPGGSQLEMEESGPLRGDEDGVSSPEVMAARVSLRIFFFGLRPVLAVQPLWLN